MTYTNTSAPTDCDVDAAIAFLNEQYFPNTCAIQRPSANTADGMGGQTDPTYTALTNPLTNTTSFACLDEQATRKEQESVAHITSVAVRSIKFAGGTDIRLKDQIVIGSAPARTLEVIQVTTLESYELVRPVLTIEIT